MKKYKRSDKCELVYVSVAWNVLDEDQRKDVEYINSYPNKAGRIRECVRAMRTGTMVQQMSVYGIPEPVKMNDDTFEEVSELDAIELLTR
jgi:hypothetical protein